MKNEVVTEVSHKSQDFLIFDYQIITLKSNLFCKDLK
ncbi:hypothetical protein HME9304_02222 [Flagellimonas maritima]|uniref:Uncharacterized protein n=1 Tax=Flagellimonas maritima TaxID=1383885 RepID=A0A2Z4LU40_9FLAO|nr:hypothetical protein HME9304_02222 [Allomuricauda aurantiaca]